MRELDELRDKASEGPSATRIKEVDDGDSFTIETPALYSADEVSAEDEFPYHGDWFVVLDEDGQQAGYLEVARALAQDVVHAVDVDDISFPVNLTIESVEMGDDEWRIETSIDEAE